MKLKTCGHVAFKLDNIMWNILSINDLGWVQGLRRVGGATVIMSGRSENNTTETVVSFMMRQTVKSYSIQTERLLLPKTNLCHLYSCTLIAVSTRWHTHWTITSMNNVYKNTRKIKWTHSDFVHNIQHKTYCTSNEIYNSLITVW